MTFEQARERNLADLDKRYARLRAVAMDKAWCNDSYREYLAAFAELVTGMQNCRKLNEAEMNATG